MKKYLALFLLLVPASLFAQAQGSFYSGVVQTQTGLRAGATITVCSTAAIASSPTGATESANTVTITTSSPHGFVAGQIVQVAGVTQTLYNGTFTILTVPTNLTFTYTNANSGLSASGGGIVLPTNVPCSPTTTIYSDIGLTAPLTQPILSSGLGNFSFFAPVGVYVYTISGQGITTASGGPFLIQLPISSGSNIAFTGNNTFSGTVTVKNINRVRMVDFANLSGWAGADACAWINSAVADIGAGVTGIVDARGLAGGVSTCTSGAVVVPQGITLLIAGQINTNSNFSFTGGTVAGGISGGFIGVGKFNTLINCTTAVAGCVTIGDGVNIMRGFSLESMKIQTIGTAIKVSDGATHVSYKHLQLNPSLSCVTYATGSIGQQFQDWDDMRCDGNSGVGFNANLSAGTGGTNLQLTNVYVNDSGSTTGTIGFDIEKWLGVTINTSDHDSNGATGSTVGFKMAGVGGTGSFTINGAGCESMPTGSSCFSIVGPGVYTFTSPYGVSIGLAAFAPGSLIDVSAVCDVTIFNPFSSATGGTNDIVFEAAAAGGNYEVFGGGQTSKPIIANSPTIFQLFKNNQVTQGLGINTQPRNGGALGIGEGTAPSAITRVEFDRAGSHKQEVGNEGVAQGVITGSAQDDGFWWNETFGAINFSTNSSATKSFSIPAAFVGSGQVSISVAFTTTAVASEAVTITGLTSSGHCSVTPTNAGAAGGVASFFLDTYTANSVTFHHTATSGWTVHFLCTPN